MKATKNQATRHERPASDQLFQIRRRFKQCLRKVILNVFKTVIRCARQKYVKYAHIAWIIGKVDFDFKLNLLVRNVGKNLIKII